MLKGFDLLRSALKEKGLDQSRVRTEIIHSAGHVGAMPTSLYNGLRFLFPNHDRCTERQPLRPRCRPAHRNGRDQPRSGCRRDHLLGSTGTDGAADHDSRSGGPVHQDAGPRPGACGTGTAQLGRTDDSGHPVASGIYYCTLQTEAGKKVKPITLLSDAE